MNILVIEDNLELNKAICKTLIKSQNVRAVESAYNGEDGLYMALNNDYDIILLDMMLPKMQGIEVLKKIREVKETGICILSALSDKAIMINGLKSGADDYIVKPFDNDELIARIESIYRRHSKTVIKNEYQFGGMTIDYETTTIKINGEPILLNGKMYEMFEYIIRHKNTIITKDRLFTRVWGFDSETIYTVTEVYISKLRKILEKFDMKKYLVTIKNIGYMWDETRVSDAV